MRPKSHASSANDDIDDYDVDVDDSDAVSVVFNSTLYTLFLGCLVIPPSCRTFFNYVGNPTSGSRNLTLSYLLNYLLLLGRVDTSWCE